jgi:acetyl-CoA carboxylase biotin carboxyl carrier protein
MRDGGLNQVDLKVGRLSIRLRGGANGSAEAVDATRSGAVAQPATAVTVAEHVITAPMVGTFYDAPSPGAAPFVDVGDQIAAGQVVGIIEAMKIMNEIVADQSGVIAAILASNGQSVEYGSPLLLLTPTEPVS